jgi:hypothetical protein
VQLKCYASIEVDAAPERVFDFATELASFPRMLLPLGPLPGIVSIEMLDGAAPARGARRVVRMSDKSEIFEQILDLDRPRRHRYRWLNAPAPPFSLLVARGEGDWLFSACARGTRIEWTYTFDLTSPLAAPFAMPVLALFRRWMQRGLARTAELA